MKLYRMVMRSPLPGNMAGASDIYQIESSGQWDIEKEDLFNESACNVQSLTRRVMNGPQGMVSANTAKSFFLLKGELKVFCQTWKAMM